MAISLSKIAQMLPGVLKATGTAIDLNGLFLTDSAYAPVGAVPSFSSADEVKAYFGSASIEYTAAVLYFAAFTGKTQMPGKLYLADSIPQQWRHSFVPDRTQRPRWHSSSCFLVR